MLEKIGSKKGKNKKKKKKNNIKRVEIVKL